MTASRELLLAFLGYFVVLAVISVIAWRKTRDSTDFALGGRRLSWFTAALSAHASDMSGWLLLGVPGLIYVTGLSGIWILVGLWFGALGMWCLVANRLRRATSPAYASSSITLPQFFTARTGSDSPFLRLIPALVIIVFYSVYVASGFVAGAKLLESVVGWTYLQALIAGTVIILVYVIVGGFLAASWTDSFQALLMLGALLLLPMLADAALNPDAVLNTELITSETNAIGMASALAWGLGYFGQPHILARFMAINHVDQIPKAAIFGLSWMLLCSTGAVAIGLFGAELIPSLGDPERIFIQLAGLVLNPWVAGIVIAAILAAVMSTVDSQLIVASVSIVHDLQLTKKRGLVASRLTVLFLCLVAFTVAVTSKHSEFGQSVLSLVAFAWAGLGATFGPSILFSLYWARTNAPGIVFGFLVGTITTFLWQIYAAAYFGLLGELYAIIPGFALTSTVIVACGYIWPDERAKARAITPVWPL